LILGNEFRCCRAMGGRFASIRKWEWTEMGVELAMEMIMEAEMAASFALMSGVGV